MLLLMAVAGVVLAMEVSSVQEDLDKYRKLTLEGGGKPAPKEDMSSYSNALVRAMNPPQVDFATANNQPVPAEAGAAQVFFAGRGRLTLSLEGWTEKLVTARSGTFGRVEFVPQAFSRIVFAP
ncbi:MAG: hypothetical protein EB141_15725 [Verrucomicrobia bacterium]|nr:hypothetical protein [Verrucomicrobiota bacterium]